MSVNQLLLEAIALKKCVTATYNNVQMTLAPHILYSKHDALFVDAVAIERNGVAPKEVKLGAFHLSGLKELALAEGQTDASSCNHLGVLRLEPTIGFEPMTC